MRALLILPFVLCTPLIADQITLANGDRLTGDVIKFDGKELTIKSQYGAVVVFPWSAVVGINSTTTLNFGLKDGQLIVGTATTTDGKIQVQTKDTGPVVIAKDSITAIRSKDEQSAYEAEIERYRNPRLLDLWTGFVDFGYAKASGNAETSNLNVSATATRATTRDKINVHFTSLYADAKVNNLNSTTANAIRGGVAYDLNLTPRTFAFGLVDLEYDQFQALDLRFAPAGGFGYHVLKGKRSLFDVLGGVALDRSFFSTGLQRTEGQALIGETYTFNWSKTSSLHENLTFYPDFTGGANYRMNFDTSWATVIRKWLSWQVTASDRLLSNPVPGFKKNDVIFTTGVRVTFAK